MESDLCVRYSAELLAVAAVDYAILGSGLNHHEKYDQTWYERMLPNEDFSQRIRKVKEERKRISDLFNSFNRHHAGSPPRTPSFHPTKRDSQSRSEVAVSKRVVVHSPTVPTEVVHVPESNPVIPLNNPVVPLNNPVIPLNNPVTPLNNPVLPLTEDNPVIPLNNPVIPLSEDNPVIPIPLISRQSENSAVPIIPIMP